MTPKPLQTKFRGWTVQTLVAVLCALLLAPGDTLLYAQPALPQGSSPEQAAPKIPNDQLDSLVAPIALYPDPLLSQVLVASTYPLEIIQLQQWLQKNGTLKGDALTQAVEKQDWDPSIQAMAALPDVVKRLGDDIKWTTDLGNAFLAQQSDVMDAVQRMRMKAKDTGNLKSNEQQTVEVKTVETKTVIVVQQTNPQVVYVPVYSPTVVYGPPIYPYPPIYYPPPSYYAAGVAVAFGVGIAIGAAYHGGWGYGCGWGSNNNVNINVNNNYVSHYNNTNINNVNKNNINNVNKNGSNNWQHNPQHRGGTPYSNQATANKYGGSTRGASTSTRQANAQKQQGAGNRQQPSTSNRAAGNQNAAATNRGTPKAGGSQANTAANRGGSSSGNNIGNRQAPSNSSSRNTSAFGGSSSKSSAQASSSRGASSMGSSRSGGAARSGGGGGGRKR